MFSGKMPNITQAQVLAALTWIVSQAVTMGIADQQTSKVILSAGSSILAAAWVIGDAYLRSNRAKAIAADPNTKLEN